MKGQYMDPWGVFVCELRDSYTPGNCGILVDGVPLTRQPPLLLGSLPEQPALKWKLHHLEGKSGYCQKSEIPGNIQQLHPANSCEPYNTGLQVARVHGFKGSQRLLMERSAFSWDKERENYIPDTQRREIMGRQRNNPHMKEKQASPEKDVNEMEASNLSENSEKWS
uniref:Uncharacterized protein n=1 Tax=Pipistrellus kuhlii TaxID=59472 RepID=A0A7J7UTX5_PIPKU|nr:hypothetical protein mPipKuh1_008737 [Pipistrellus kuhlii]